MTAHETHSTHRYTKMNGDQLYCRFVRPPIDSRFFDANHQRSALALEEAFIVFGVGFDDRVDLHETGLRAAYVVFELFAQFNIIVGTILATYQA